MAPVFCRKVRRVIAPLTGALMLLASSSSASAQDWGGTDLDPGQKAVADFNSPALQITTPDGVEMAEVQNGFGNVSIRVDPPAGASADSVSQGMPLVHSNGMALTGEFSQGTLAFSDVPAGNYTLTSMPGATIGAVSIVPSAVGMAGTAGAGGGAIAGVAGVAAAAGLGIGIAEVIDSNNSSNSDNSTPTPLPTNVTPQPTAVPPRPTLTPRPTPDFTRPTPVSRFN